MNFDWSLPPGEPVAVAISGGADSFALLHVLHEKDIPVVGLTVDHGLRPEAAGEAAKVAKWCAERGILHETLTWTKPPKGGVQAAARTARYRLLCEACNRLGIATLVTGHTADDQAETVFMRLRRGAGRGLAGMPEQRLIAGGAGEPVTLYRPMLGIRRAESLAYAEAHDLPISHDPSNEDDRFERVRIRALLAALEQQDLLTVEALCRTAREQSEIDKAIIALTRSGVCLPFTEDGASIFADQDSLETAGGEVIAARLIHAISGAEHSGVRAVDLYSLQRPTTIMGIVIQPYAGNGWALIREPAALLGRADGAGGFEPIPVQAGEKHLYDRRFIVHVPDILERDSSASSSEAIGQTKIRPLGALMPRDIAASTLDRQRISTLPCLSRGERLSHIPATCVGFVRSALSGWKQAEDFLDGVDIFTADSLLEERFTGRVIRF